MSDTHQSFSDDELLDLMRRVQPADYQRVAPPAEVWSGIVQEVQADNAAAPVSLDQRRAARSTAAPAVAESAPTGAWILKAAAALVVVLGLGAVGTAVLRDRGPEPVTVAMTSLVDDGLQVATTAEGSAAVVCQDGACVVEIELTEVPDPGNAALELWVIDTNVEGMHSLGEVRSSGSYPLPDGVEFEDFPIVDISVEPRDGVAAHSGQSVLRGVLSQTS